MSPGARRKGMDRSSARARVLIVTAATFVVAALVISVPAGAEARAATCQGQAATIEGPTQGQNTNGTEGDDVIVAPLSSNSEVSALGGNDTICLVDGPQAGSRDPIVTVKAGAGDDLVVNETTHAPGDFRVELGIGVDHYIGVDYGETVYGAGLLYSDTEPDTFETHGGPDSIYSGTGLPGYPNQDVIETGAGRDVISYGGPAGGSIDNGPDADLLGFVGAWSGGFSIDNVSRHANLGGETVLSWTAIDTFFLRAEPGSYVSFAGSDAPETLGVSGTVLDLAAPAATIETGGGDDSVRLENYLPASVDLGDGYDTLSYLQCERAYVQLEGEAACITDTGTEVDTQLKDVDYFFGVGREVMNLRGTDRAERVSVRARFVNVRTLGGRDRVQLGGRTVSAYGGRGEDRIKVAAKNGSKALGGRGADVLRGHSGRDALYGGRGRDVAYGMGGRDLCRAEVENGCEL